MFLQQAQTIPGYRNTLRETLAQLFKLCFSSFFHDFAEIVPSIWVFRHALVFDILLNYEIETRWRLDEQLETIRVYRQIGSVRRQAALTASPDPRYYGSTNVNVNMEKGL